MERIDLRSDTVTLPSYPMRAAMANAPVGDDQYGEDPTVRALQERIATLLGKEAAIFVPSGTMANQIGLKLLTRPGDDVVVGDEAHIVWHESGAAAANSGVQFTVVGRGGLFTAEDLRAAFKPPGHIIFPPTTLVAVENTHNRGGGVVFPQEDAVAICAAARELGVATLSGRRAAVQHVGGDQALACRTGGAVRRGVGGIVEGAWLPGGERDRRARGRHGAGGAGAAHVRRRDAPVRHSGRRRAVCARQQHRAAGRGPCERADHGRAAGGYAGGDRSCDGAEQHRDLPRAEPLPDAATVVRRAQEQGVLVSAFAARTVRAVTHLNVDAAQCRHAAEVLAGDTGGEGSGAVVGRGGHAIAIALLTGWRLLRAARVPRMDMNLAHYPMRLVSPRLAHGPDVSGVGWVEQAKPIGKHANIVAPMTAVRGVIQKKIPRAAGEWHVAPSHAMTDGSPPVWHAWSVSAGRSVRP